MAGAALLMAAGFLVLVIAFPETRASLADPTVSGGLVLGVTFPIVGWLVATRRPENAIGWVFLGVGLSQALVTFGGRYAMVGLDLAPGSLPAADIVAWISVWSWAPGFTLLLTATVLLFPDGRPPSRRWWPVLWAAGLAMTMIVVPMAIATWGIRGPALLGSGPSPEDLAGPAATLLPLVNVGLVLLLLCAAVSIVGLIVRFRRSAGVARAQLKWFVGAGIVEISLLVATSLVELPIPALNMLLAILVAPLVPIAAGIAILRYHLYDIDRIVSRTLSYTILTGLLAALFAGLVLGLQDVLASITGAGTLAVAASTLAVAALFQPLRRRVQRTVDRRFDRARYDGERVATALSSRLRDETDLALVRGEIEEAVRQALAPSSTVVWMRSR
jgi:hypothetical protein